MTVTPDGIKQAAEAILTVIEGGESGGEGAVTRRSRACLRGTVPADR